jgi:hypothetical protein
VPTWFSQHPEGGGAATFCCLSQHPWKSLLVPLCCVAVVLGATSNSQEFTALLWMSEPSIVTKKESHCQVEWWLKSPIEAYQSSNVL